MGIAAAIRNLGARRRGNNYRCACPLDCGYDLSLASGEDGKLLAFCHGGCTYDQVVPALVPYGLLDADDAGCFISPPSSSKPSPLERIEAARRIYDSLAPAAQTPAERYLRGRAITLPVPSTLRFGAAPHRCGGRLPAMVAPVINVDGVLTGIHVTYLRPDGSGKADLPRDLQRETRGIVRNGTIRLAEHDPDRELAVGEGIESVLSIMQRLELPGWSTVSANGLGTAELPPAVRRIVIAVDYDRGGAGQRNAAAAMRRWQGEGRVVRAVLPKIIGTDFNDLAERRRG
jgi:hypothetical protein